MSTAIISQTGNDKLHHARFNIHTHALLESAMVFLSTADFMIDGLSTEP